VTLAFHFYSFAQQKSSSGKLEIPKTNPSDIIITHTGYSLLYNETHEQANWVAYELTKEETTKIVDRTNKFMVDPLVKTGTANDNDYAGSGYDKGHLAPAADMGWSSTTMTESFYYSNMSPQEPGFNRGVWKRLEELVRTWAIENNSIYIVTGPVLIAGLPTIGVNKVSVPKYFYKVILDYNEPSIKGIGFIMTNTSSGEPLQTFAVTIDSVENLTGIDFFPLLPDDQEKKIESTLCTSCWSWNSNKSKSESKSSVKVKKSVQCSGTTKAGNRCKRMTLSPNGRCYQHGGN
jgi:endonuclease G